jgi:hypothetical protein
MRIVRHVGNKAAILKSKSWWYNNDRFLSLYALACTGFVSIARDETFKCRNCSCYSEILGNQITDPVENLFVGAQIIHTITYLSHFIPEGIAEISQMFLRDTPTFYQKGLAMRNTADVTGGDGY